jgi:hypothetical protein
MKMQCEEVQNRLIEYLDKMLDNTLNETIEKHIGTCEKCKDEARELQMMVQMMEKEKESKPDHVIEDNFKCMLQSEMEKVNRGKHALTVSPKSLLKINWSSPLLKIAACFALLVTGTIIGMNLKSGLESRQSGQFTELRDEVREMKEMMMFTLLKEESPSERIKAVNYAEELPSPNQKVIIALINTLNNDKNVNVRLAAAYSLAKFSDNQFVIDSLVESLNNETEPIIQIVMINILTDKREIKAIKPMRKIISDSKTIKEVKDIASESIRVIL